MSPFANSLVAPVFALLQSAANPSSAAAQPVLRDPAYGPDGRLAVSIDGDLWIQRSAGRSGGWVRLTSGPAWDRQPAWGADGRSIVFVSDRGGNTDLWRIPASADGASSVAAAERLTRDPAPDAEPWVGRDGSVVFTRGRGPTSRLWVLAPDGAERRLTTFDRAERWGAIAPAGDRVAYVQFGDAGGRLRVRALAPAVGTAPRAARSDSGTGASARGANSADGRGASTTAMDASASSTSSGAAQGAMPNASDSVVLADRDVQRPAWSPAGDRLAFASDSPRGGVYVTPTDGRYVNLVSERVGNPAWSPDGRTIVIAERTETPQGYNGDPDRVGDRDIAELLASRARLTFVDAPAPPDVSPAEVAAPDLDRAERNAQVFDRVWGRIDSVYFSEPRASARQVSEGSARAQAVSEQPPLRAQPVGRQSTSARRAAWRKLRDEHRPRALAATDDHALAQAIHAMLRERPTLRDEPSGRAAVSSAHPVASAAGVEIMAKGGNVVDAAVAVSFALGVVEPDASGIGGYGEMLVHMKGMERPALIEFMARAPEEASLANGALLENGRYPLDGPVLAMVPGTVAGMHAAWKRFGSGKMPWADLLAPAIRAARDGYEVSDGLATTLAVERASFAKYESSRALFFRNDKPLVAGDTVRNPDLAWTLERIARGGADGFYRGEVASRLVSDLRGKGNAIRLTDMARYFAPERDPVHFTYRGNAVYSSAPPAGGGALLAGQLSNLEQVPPPRPYAEDAAALHAMISAWQLAPSSRGRVADPGFWPTTTEPFTNKDTAQTRWRCFDPAKALAPDVFRGDTLRCAAAKSASLGIGTPRDPSGAADASSGTGGERRHEDMRADRPANDVDDSDCAGLDHAAGHRCRPQGTTAFTVGDADGNLVAVTQTNGTWGGNFYVTPGLGFLYNDKLTSFATEPNAYGARVPLARHGSTLAPTIVFRGTGAEKRPWFAIGAAGNAWITSAVFSGVVGMTDLGLGPQRALELPRFLPGQRSTGARREFVIYVEDGMSPQVVRTLEAMGHHIVPISLMGELRMGYGAAVLIDGARVLGGGDPRRSGVARVVGGDSRD